LEEQNVLLNEEFK